MADRMWNDDGCGRCPECFEDELEGGVCKYCGHELTEAEWALPRKT